MVRTALTHLRRWARAAAVAVRSWSAWIWERVLDEPGYVEAIASLAVAITELFCRAESVRRLTHDVSRMLILIIRDLQHTRYPDAGTTWS